MILRKDPIRGVQISIGIGKIFRAHTEEELRHATDHYFDFGIWTHVGLDKKCPLCHNEED